ncbi:hypothetical protein DE146DRAFT_213491 [Phaeosphaeria sp. MPI-PUGE-AT-0046c]|nr:hypothetical protein DE146DRAFT_213491 [Phaeosphaeria sp. MPI-PUGE-AT-0046c]
MMEHFPLLRLPRELRDVVYQHYMRSKDGFVADFATNKLKNGDGSCIDLALRLTCRQIATETRGLALQTNTITFQNTFQKDAGLFHVMHASLFYRKYRLLWRIAPQLLTPETASSIKEKYPQFSPFIDDSMGGGSWLSDVFPRLAANIADTAGFGEAPSLFRDFVSDLLLELSQNPGFLPTVAALNERSATSRIQGDEHAMQLARTTVQTWKVYETADVQTMRKVARAGFLQRPRDRPGCITKSTYSATTCAVRFLEALSTTDRMDLRHLLLVENSHIRAATQGAAHARGLIPFCCENPQLSIVRRANLWHTILPDVSTKRMQLPEMLAPASRELRVAELSKGIGVWLAEYSVLSGLGMPEGAYSLVIDVDGEEPDKAAEVFDIVQRDAVRQEELDSRYERGMLSWFERRKALEYSFECLPDMLRQIARGNAGIRCSFEWASWRVEDGEQK